MFAQEQVDGHCSSMACKQLVTPCPPQMGGGWSSGGLKLMNAASCLSDPLHFTPDRLRGLQVVAEGAAEPELMTGLCLALGLSSG